MTGLFPLKIKHVLEYLVVLFDSLIPSQSQHEVGGHKGLMNE